MRRHYTDVGYGNHPIKQKPHRQMFEWIPYFRAHNMNWDDPETGEERVLTGKELSDGFTMTVEKRAGQIWFFERV